MSHRVRLGWAILCLTLTFSLPLLAQPLPPKLTVPVNDFAHVIDASSAQEIERRVRALEKASGDVVVVATVPTFQPYGDIKEYAVKMFENGGSGIGQRGKDNGVLIVVAVDDRKVGIEVGYGLEEFITDGFAGQTIREAILPGFRSGNYGDGLVAGTTRIINRIADARGVNLQDVPREAPRQQPQVHIPIGAIIFILFLILMMTRGRRRRRRYWGGPWSGWNSGVGPFGGGFGGGFGGFGGGGGGGGGGFGGFGGGRSGGGGASGGGW